MGGKIRTLKDASRQATDVSMGQYMSLLKFESIDFWVLTSAFDLQSKDLVGLVIELDFGLQSRVADVQEKCFSVADLRLFQHPQLVIQRGRVPPRIPQNIQAGSPVG